MKKIKVFPFLLLFLFTAFHSFSQDKALAPAYPLITHDTYFSAWSFGDELNTTSTKLCTGNNNSLLGILKLDGKLYRFLGKTESNFKTLLAASDEAKHQVKYTFDAPAGEWNTMSFDDCKWKQDITPFGNDEHSKTKWDTDNIYLRRSFSLNKLSAQKKYLKLQYDDNVKVYLNVDLIYDKRGCVHDYIYIPIEDNVLKEGSNILAIHCENTAGGQYIDASFVEEVPQGNNVLTAKQTNVNIQATQTLYTFQCGPVNLHVTFTSPLLLKDIQLTARPVSYISYAAKSNDGEAHGVELYFSTSSNMAVHTTNQEVSAWKKDTNGLSILKTGTVEQPLLKRSGDNVRIDWGYLYVAIPSKFNAKQKISKQNETYTNGSFLKGVSDNLVLNTTNLTLENVISFGKVQSKAVEKYIMFGYDDIMPLQYFGENLPPLWKSKYTTFEEVLQTADSEFSGLMAKCAAFDKKLYDDAIRVGGKEYADLCKLAYRQSISAHKIVYAPSGDFLFLSKENHSNGSINTDITYPSAPQYLLYSPELLKVMLNGIFYYSESGRWKKPFPAHDLGTYPLANGQTYGEDMPVEEAGNMIILTAAIAKTEGNADYANKYWPTLSIWAKYLLKEGLDSANQ